MNTFLLSCAPSYHINKLFRLLYSAHPLWLNQVATRTVSQSRRQIKEGAMSSLEESAQRLWLYTRGADLLKSDDATYVIINKALVRGTGTVD